jgi:hypothetical protein
MSLTREEILASRADRRPVPLEVAEWGGTIYLRQLTVTDQVALSENNTPAEMPVAVLIACICDEKGTALFHQADKAELAQESFSIILRVFAEAAKLNGLSTAELDEAMASFERARTSSGPSASPSLSADPSQNSETSPVLS